MKKILAVLLSLMLIGAASGCSSQKNESNAAADAANDTTAAQETSAAAPGATAAAADPALPKGMEETIQLHGFEGVIYATENGKPVASYAKGTLENGTEITLDSPLPIGSVSKQFCAAAILLLQEQGKLSVSDTLDKYFPDYAQGKSLTLHNLLSMRSGIPELTEESGSDVTMENTEAQNVAAIKKWVFSQPLTFEPDEMFAYCNVNYFLLADIVEQVSGQKYTDFLRGSFFTPLGMTHSGFIGELPDSPAWAQGNTYEKVERSQQQLAKYYSTNTAGQKKKKTISVDGSASDWDSSMLIAQGTANDDPRVYRPNSMYEMPIDLYALYGTYDDDNLYLMWEMTNVQDVVDRGDDFPLNRPVHTEKGPAAWIALDTGRSDNRVGKNANLQTGGTIWDSRISWEQNVNNVIGLALKKGENGPWMYSGDETGLNANAIYGPGAAPAVGTQKTKMQYAAGTGLDDHTILAQ